MLHPAAAAFGKVAARRGHAVGAGFEAGDLAPEAHKVTGRGERYEAAVRSYPIPARSEADDLVSILVGGRRRHPARV